MSTINVSTAPTTAATTRTTRVSWRSGLVTVGVTAIAVTLLAVVLRVAGLGLEVGGEPVPALGFAQMVALGGVVGIVLARRSSRTAFLRATVVLTALSCVPSIALGDTLGDRLGLVLTHVVAAAIIVPRLARS
jgi:hypothetical protein